MKLLDSLLYHIRQLELSGKELAEAVNHKDKGSRLNEIEGYYRLLGQVLEKLKDQHYRHNPDQAVRRTLIRTWSKIGYEPLPTDSRDETKT